jgi:hypothetical protein
VTAKSFSERVVVGIAVSVVVMTAIHRIPELRGIVYGEQR